MTKIESRSPAELDELPPWDDSEVPLDRVEVQSMGTESRPLTVYSLDSEQRTLVGLGPLERARRLRQAAEAPDSQRMPLSEPPGPFIADDELPVSFRTRKLGKRALAVPGVLLVGLALVGVVRGLSPHEPAPGRLARTFAARALPAAQLAARRAAPPKVEQGAQEPAGHAAVEATEASQHERSLGRPGSALGVEAVPPSVTLPDLPPSTAVVDRSGGDSSAGSINVTSTPPSNVVLDGRPLGKSPRVVRVPPGSHTVVFIHPLYGRRSLNVKVRAGATAGAAAEF